jgi:hypothetical protein
MFQRFLFSIVLCFKILCQTHSNGMKTHFAVLETENLFPKLQPNRLLFSLTLYRKLMHHESLEEWELDCPHRFRYRDLYAATKGFKESEVIGVGGFGAVFKGILPATGSEVVGEEKESRIQL